MIEYVVIILLIVFLFAFIVGRTAVGKRKSIIVSQGDSGERYVSHILSHLSAEYHVFNDVYLNSNGRSSQIDHVVISKFGIFVIETKNYSGAIYGSENMEHWTQYLQGEGYNSVIPFCKIVLTNWQYVTPSTLHRQALSR